MRIILGSIIALATRYNDDVAMSNFNLQPAPMPTGGNRCRGGRVLRPLILRLAWYPCDLLHLARDLSSHVLLLLNVRILLPACNRTRLPFLL